MKFRHRASSQDGKRTAVKGAATNPFSPRPGRRPPELAGRDRECVLFTGQLQELLAGRDPSEGNVILYGPRGNGKTVLLGEVRRLATARGLRVLGLKSAASASRLGEVAAEQTYDAGETRSWSVGVELVDHVALRGSHTRHRGAGAGPETVEGRLLTLLQGGTRGLVVTLDEAHVVPPAFAQEMLAATERLQEDGYPLLLFMAGTPELRDFLGRVHATFWNRNITLPLGRLPTEADVTCALGVPLEKTGIGVTSGAMGLLAGEAQRYPYFVQVLGSECWKATAGVEGGSVQVTETLLAECVLPTFQQRKNAYYGQRARELADLGLRQVAAAVGRAVQQAPGHCLAGEATDGAVRQALEDAWGLRGESFLVNWEAFVDGLERRHALTRPWLQQLRSKYDRLATSPNDETAWNSMHAGTVPAVRRVFEDLGYLWAPGAEDGPLELGIPSLADYLARDGTT